MNRHNPTSAFTLIELLVVITIIVVLLALLAPALDRAIGMAEATVCAAHLKGLGTATAQYVMDHKRQYPVPGTWAEHRPHYEDPTKNNLSSYHSWHTDRNGETGIRPLSGAPPIGPKNPLEPQYPGGDLWPYAQSEEMFICPVFPSLFDSAAAQQHFANKQTQTHTPAEQMPGDAYTMHFGLQPGGTQGLEMRRYGGNWRSTDGGPSYPASHSGTLLFTEESLWSIPAYASGGRNDTMLAVTRSRNPAAASDVIGNYHFDDGNGANESDKGTGNVTFMDGHVARYHPSHTKSLAWPGMLSN